MIEQAVNSGDLLKMTDLEDLNGAFYDIDAQDLLDVWEAMDSGVRTIGKIYKNVYLITSRVIRLSEFR